MSECIGIFGKLFGHSFRRYLIKEKYKRDPYTTYNVHGSDNFKAFLECQQDVYIVKCKRCGLDPNGES